MEVYVGQQGTHDASLRCTSQGFLPFSLMHDTCMQELPEQVSDAPVCYSLLHRFHYPPVRYGVEVARYVTLNDPLVDAPIAGEPIANVGDGVIGASLGPESIGMDTKVSFP